MNAGPPDQRPPSGPSGYDHGDEWSDDRQPHRGHDDGYDDYDDYDDGPLPSSADRARAGYRATARGFKGVAKVSGRAGRFAVRNAQRAANAQGADQSGLNRLIYLHATNAAGDAAFAISLATSVFFAGATSDARGQVALFLGLTMLPFAIVAPLLGPFLDRFRHGRRWAIGGTFVIRAFLCWVLAGAVADDSALLYPCALGVLVASKAYGVTRAAAIPRLVPDGITLVKANGRVSLAGVAGGAISAPIAGAAAYFGAEWSLRFAFLVFLLGTAAAILLPAKVDSSKGEETVSLRERGESRGRGATHIPPAVAYALRANCGPRFLSGFLTMFMAFLLRDHPIGDFSPAVLVGLVIGGAGIGNTLGIVLASSLRRINPAVTVTFALLADAAIVLAGALFYGVLLLVALGLTAGLAQAMAKVSLDSTIQGGVPTYVQASAFARSDTTLQLAWVVGGFVGIAMPLVPGLGLGVAFAVLAAWTLFVLSTAPGRTGGGSARGGRGRPQPPRRQGSPPQGRPRQSGPQQRRPRQDRPRQDGPRQDGPHQGRRPDQPQQRPRRGHPDKSGPARPRPPRPGDTWPGDSRPGNPPTAPRPPEPY